MCTELGVSTSGYYAWRRRLPSARHQDDVALLAAIRTALVELDGNPGVRRMWAHLRAAGWRVAHQRVYRLMRADGLQGRHQWSLTVTTVSGAKPVDAPDLIGRDFTATAPNTRWCGDITYTKCWDGWAYLATVIDLHSRAIVGWALARHMRTSLVTDALDAAIANRAPNKPVIFHSDRGTQYTSDEFDRYCYLHNIIRPLGRTGICYDNAVSESFFATYKKELIHTRPWPTLHRLRRETFAWINGYYYTRRRHSSINYLTPQEYELGYRTIDELTA